MDRDRWSGNGRHRARHGRIRGGNGRHEGAVHREVSGTAVTKQTDSTVDITANGSGRGTLIGAGKVTGLGKADSSVRPCVPFNGAGSMKGPGGAITFKVTPGTAGCGDDAGQLFSITGKASVVTATGKLAKAKGTLKLTGTYDRSSGAFSVKFSGILTK